MNTPDVSVRRIVVESLVNFVKDSMANFQLVNVFENTGYTDVEFDLYHPYRGIDSANVKRVLIRIETEAEPIPE